MAAPDPQPTELIGKCVHVITRAVPSVSLGHITFFAWVLNLNVITA